MEAYSVKVVRTAGLHPITKAPITHQEATFSVNGSSVEDAKNKGMIEAFSAIKFQGAEMQISVNGQPCLGNF